jgi:hypothetical protein
MKISKLGVRGFKARADAANDFVLKGGLCLASVKSLNGNKLLNKSKKFQLSFSVLLFTTKF